MYSSLVSASPASRMRNLSSGVLRIWGDCNRHDVEHPPLKYSNSDNHCYNLIELTKGSLLCTMVGLSSTDPSEPNPIRVEDDSQVQRVLIKRFKVTEGEVQFYVRDESTGTFVPLPPA